MVNINKYLEAFQESTRFGNWMEIIYVENFAVIYFLFIIKTIYTGRYFHCQCSVSRGWNLERWFVRLYLRFTLTKTKFWISRESNSQKSSLTLTLLMLTEAANYQIVLFYIIAVYTNTWSYYHEIIAIYFFNYL